MQHQFSRSNKRQSSGYRASRTMISGLKGSWMRAAEIENAAVWATSELQVLPKVLLYGSVIRSWAWSHKDLAVATGQHPRTSVCDVQNKLARQQVVALAHPLYSPDLAPCDFVLFLRLKEKLIEHYCHRRNRTRYYCKWLSKVFTEDILILADVHSCKTVNILRVCVDLWKYRWGYCDIFIYLYIYNIYLFTMQPHILTNSMTNQYTNRVCDLAAECDTLMLKWSYEISNYDRWRQSRYRYCSSKYHIYTHWCVIYMNS